MAVRTLVPTLMRNLRSFAGSRFDMSRRSNPAGPALADRWEQSYGIADNWAPSEYGDYLAVNPTLYACVDLRARNLARVRLNIHRAGLKGDPDGAPVPQGHPAQRLLLTINPHWSAFRFWYIVEASLCLWGSAPVAIFRDSAGTPAELWWLHPSRFRVVPHPTQYIQGYLYEKDGQAIAFGPQDIVWFRYPNPLQEFMGLSPLAALRMTIDTSTDAIRFNRRFFQNDATPGRVYIKTDAELTSKQADELRIRWEQAFKDPNKAHKVAVLDKAAELKALGIGQRDMEFIDGQRFTKEEIAGAFGISPVMIGDLSKSSLNNYNTAKSSFWDETMLPEMQLIESELDQSLLPQFGTSEGRYMARFDTTQVSALKENGADKAKRYQILVQTGIMTVNEVRAREGLDPVAWGDEPPKPPPVVGAKPSQDVPKEAE